MSLVEQALEAACRAFLADFDHFGRIEIAGDGNVTAYTKNDNDPDGEWCVKSEYIHGSRTYRAFERLEERFLATGLPDYVYLAQ